MQTYDERIAPGSALKITITGSIFYIKSSTAGEVLTVEFVNGSAQGAKVQNVGKGFKAAPASRFDGVRITASVETQVEFIISDGGIDFAFNTDDIIIGNDDSRALPVRTPPGQPLMVHLDEALEIGSVTITNDDSEAIPVRHQALLAIVPAAPVNVAMVATLISADATLRILQIRNSHPTATLAIGGPTVTVADAAILLQPGDIWIESDAAGASWYAISSGPVISVKIQGLK